MTQSDPQNAAQKRFWRRKRGSCWQQNACDCRGKKWHRHEAKASVPPQSEGCRWPWIMFESLMASGFKFPSLLLNMDKRQNRLLWFVLNFDIAAGRLHTHALELNKLFAFHDFKVSRVQIYTFIDKIVPLRTLLIWDPQKQSVRSQTPLWPQRGVRL